MEYGPKGREFVELKPGDHFHIPPGLVHRDVNPDEKREAVVIAILVGQGTPVVNVQAP